MKSFNHKCINVRSSMKVSLFYISIIYELIIILFHLQMMPTISLIALSAVIQEVSVTISTKWHSNVIIVYNITIQYGLIIIFIIINFAHTFITMLMQPALSAFQLPCSEYTDAHAQLNSM